MYFKPKTILKSRLSILIYCQLTHDNSGGALQYKRNPLNSCTQEQQTSLVHDSYQTTRHNINITSWNKQQCNILTPHC